MAWISMPRRLTSMWPDVEFFQAQPRACRCRPSLSCARSCGRSRPFLRVRGRPASGSRRKRHWNAFGSVWRNLVGKIRQLRCSSRCRINGRAICFSRCAGVMRPYRYYRQRRNTVMVRAPKRFLDQVLWPEFSELDQALQAYLHQVTLRVIREEVYADASEAQEVFEALPPN